MTPPANASERVVIAESGDALLTLRNPGAPFAVWDHEAEDDDAAENSVITGEGNEDEGADQGLKVQGSPQKKRRMAERSRQGAENQDVSGDDAECPCFVYQVSSQHLITASPKFKSELTSWSESLKGEDGFYHINTTDWDQEAFTILLNILHLRFRQVPKSLSLELLAKVAMLVDYYRCWEAFDLIADLWITNLRKGHEIPQKYDRESMLWMLISWVFKLDKVFSSTTKNALLQNDEPSVRDMALGIPPVILQALDSRRAELIARMVKTCHKWIDHFCDTYHCVYGDTFECSSILLGALMKQAKIMGISSPQPTAPFDGMNVTGLREKIEGMQTPKWYGYRGMGDHGCNLRDTVIREVSMVATNISGLTLNDFVDRGEVEAE